MTHYNYSFHFWNWFMLVTRFQGRLPGIFSIITCMKIVLIKSIVEVNKQFANLKNTTDFPFPNLFYCSYNFKVKKTKKNGENEQLQIVLGAHKNFRYIPQCISTALILCLDKIES